jgi:DNA-binding transcriptional regulator PaaX
MADMFLKLKKVQIDLNAQLKDHAKADKVFLLTSSYIVEPADRVEQLYQSSKEEQK